MDKFNYLSKEILKNMNVVESFTGKMFHETHPMFESNFWLAHEHRDIKALSVLHNVLSKIIDDANDGHKILIEKKRSN